MRVPYRFLATVLTLSAFLCTLTLIGCDSTDLDSDAPLLRGPTSTVLQEPYKQPGSTVKSSETVDNAYLVTYEGTSFKSGKTTYKYSVSNGIQDGKAALDNFFLENACGVAPVSVSPSQSSQLNATKAGYQGVLFNKGIGAKVDRREYSYTFEGEPPVGVIHVVLTRSSTSHVVALPGPCGGLSTLGGGVQIYGAENTAGIGFPGINVEVYGGNPNSGGILVASTTTGVGGAFSFVLLHNAFTSYNDYTVVVPETGSNSYLSYYPSIPPIPGSFKLPDNASSDVEFKREGNASNIAAALGGPKATNALSLQELQNAIKAATRNGRPVTGALSKSNIAAALQQIVYDGIPNGSSLSDDYFGYQKPYEVNFDDSNVDQLLAWAEQYLKGPSNPTNTQLALLQGLGVQMNYFLGFGVQNDPDFDKAFQYYNEDFLAQLIADGGTSQNVLSENLALRIGGAEKSKSAPAPDGASTGGNIEDFLKTQKTYLAGASGSSGGGIE